MPTDVGARVHDKSSWARKFIVVQNTWIDPGWRGYLTLEISSRQWWRFQRIKAGTPIAQVVFDELDKFTDEPYEGKYQDQEYGPQPAR